MSSKSTVLCYAAICLLGGWSSQAFGTIEYYSDRSAFEAAAPGLPVEDFEEALVTRLPALVGCTGGVVDETTDDTCFVPGDILPGIAFQDSPGPDSEGLVAVGSAVVPANADKSLAVSLLSDSMDILFSGATVNSVGFDLYCMNLGDPVQTTATVSFYTAGDALLDTRVMDCDADITSFLGIRSTADITRVHIVDDSSAGFNEVIDDVAFGFFDFNPPAACNLPTNPFQNCSFETGDLSGWESADMSTPSWPLHVGPAGDEVGGFFPSAPTDGGFSALHGFNGAGPGSIFVGQDLLVPPGATSLEFDYRLGWDYTVDNPATQERVFRVVVEPPGGGAPLQTATVFTAPTGIPNVPDTGPLQGSVDLTSFAGQAVRITFAWEVPEDNTGPAQFQLDNVGVLVLPGVRVDPTSGLTTSENGDTAMFDVVLDTPPGGPVTVEFVSDDPGEGTASPATASFDDLNWNIPQGIVVTGVDDDLFDGDQPYQVISEIIVGSGPDYPVARVVDDVALINTDNNVGCVGDQLILQDGNFPAGVNLVCSATQSIGIDPGSILSGNAVVDLTAPVLMVPGTLEVKGGSTLMFRKPPP